MHSEVGFQHGSYSRQGFVERDFGEDLIAQGADELKRTVPQPDSRQGQLIVAHLASAPFPHSQRATGRTYDRQFYPAENHYADNTVALFIPGGFRETGRVDFVVHFHGWRNIAALERYRLIEQFQESRNAILVVPQGPLDAPDSFGGKLEDPGGFRRFMEEVMATLRARTAAMMRNIGIMSSLQRSFYLPFRAVQMNVYDESYRGVWSDSGVTPHSRATVPVVRCFS